MGGDNSGVLSRSRIAAKDPSGTGVLGTARVPGPLGFPPQVGGLVPGVLLNGTSPARLLDLRIDSGASELPRGPNAPAGTRYAAVNANDFVFARLVAVFSPDLENRPPQAFPDDFTWSGGLPLEPEKRWQRLVSATQPGKQVISCSSGGVTRTVVLYVLGVEHTDFRGDNGGTFHDDNLATVTRKGVVLHLKGRRTGREIPADDFVDYSDWCESQFTVKPPELISDGNAGLFKKDPIKWFVHQEMKLRSWVRVLQGMDAPWVNAAWVSQWTDDNDANKMLDPWNAGGGHLYSNDGPGLASSGVRHPEWVQIVQKMRFRQWVKVTVDGGQEWFQFPTPFVWHDFRSLKRNGSGWVEVPDFDGNELARGDKAWGASPQN
jgi:hypothetical protein